MKLTEEIATLNHLQFTRDHDCSVKSADCFGRVQAHHMVAVGSGNNRLKPSLRHFTAVPLCVKHHAEYHNRGYSGFQTEFSAPGERIDLFKLALSLTIEDLFNAPQPFFRDKI